ncbi:MAG: competence/damage-inducible protein A [Desulfobulbus sp.]|nr:competence/damage-inducible protein A [Desulfobulbus sp.]
MAKQITVEILSIGNELLRGEILDTNTHWICQLVNSRGGQVVRVTMLPDIEDEIAAAVKAAIARGMGLVFTSGGLGPTDDDLTLAAVAKGAGVDLVLHARAREMVRQRYDDFYAQGVMAEGGLNPFREKMAWLPQGAEPIHNPVGTAPGVLLQIGQTAIISLPGVPPELKGIINDSLKEFLEDRFGSGGSFARMITVRCNDESIMAPALSRVVAAYPQVYIKSLARALGEVPELDILFTATSGEAREREQWVNGSVADLQQGLTALGLEHWLKKE